MSLFGSRISGFIGSGTSGGAGIFSYGSFYDTSTQNATSITSANPVKINTTDISDANNSISIQNDSLGNPTKITFTKTGLYNITFSIQFTNADNNTIHDANCWLRKNSELPAGNIPNSNSQFSIHGKHSGINGQYIFTMNYVLSLNANDYIQICWSTTDTNVYLETLGADVSPTRPETPSVILTIFNI